MLFGVVLGTLLGQTSARIDVTSGYAVGRVVAPGRNPIPVDAVAAIIASGRWTAPGPGAVVEVPGQGSQPWTSLKAGGDGWLASDALDGGYFDTQVVSPKDQIAMLDAQGDSLAYVNGRLAIGNSYAYDYAAVPIVLKKGANDLLFLCGQGRLKVSVETPTFPIFFNQNDTTLPDVIRPGELEHGAVVLVNASSETLKGADVRAYDDAGRLVGDMPIRYDVPPIASIKVPFEFRVRRVNHPQVWVRLQVGRHSLAELGITLKVKAPLDVHKETFVSQMDDSVQYYAVNPAQDPGPDNALVLSLHGASVEASGQAAAYANKPWASIVCPTNRRPFGFDWEDWGMLDAMEVLGVAESRMPHDPSRTVLTGHSMGGHGTWHIGTTFPDQFAAIGVSAGWISFQSYGDGYTATNPDAFEELMVRATGAGDTIAHVHNLSPLGVYVLQGSADDDVPPSEARQMRDVLSPFHHDFTYFEQPGAGHWWSNTDEPGAACVDWPPMFAMFASHRIPANDEVSDVEFHTTSPNVSSHSHWLTVEQQEVPYALSSVTIHLDRHLRRFRGSTANVHAMVLDIKAAEGDSAPVRIELDGSVLINVTPADGKVTLVKNGAWTVVGALPTGEKNADRGSGLKNALRHRWIIVYGTHGDSAANDWMSHEAVFASENFWYRGNASPAIFTDDEYLAEGKGALDHDVLVIGNHETNAAWPKLAANSPVDVSSAGVRVGSSEYEGDDLSCLFCRPFGTNSMAAFLGVTGPKSMRLAERIPLLASGTGYPDYIVVSADGFTHGTASIEALGYFGNDWQLLSSK